MGAADHPITVFHSKPIEGGFAIDVPIPVAGTVLTRYPMVNEGTWMAEAEVDGLMGTLRTAFQVE